MWDLVCGSTAARGSGRKLIRSNNACISERTSHPEQKGASFNSVIILSEKPNCIIGNGCRLFSSDACMIPPAGCDRRCGPRHPSYTCSKSARAQNLIGRDSRRTNLNPMQERSPGPHVYAAHLQTRTEK